ncbi:hypothetical protein GQX74_012125 [Glossina fuscipes]|nr:hypothetical protein GQX74_012125 [Glossina fuscipes]
MFLGAQLNMVTKTFFLALANSSSCLIVLAGLGCKKRLRSPFLAASPQPDEFGGRCCEDQNNCSHSR